MASAALAEWIDLCRADWSGKHRQLVNRALFYLPITKKTAGVECGPFAALAMPEMAARLIRAFGAERLERIRSDLKRFPSCVFANALINTAWRNGPVERIHAGHFPRYPLDQWRITPVDERELMTFSSRRLAIGMDVCHRFETEHPRRRWSEQVLPYALAKILLITPSGWTLTECVIKSILAKA